MAEIKPSYETKRQKLSEIIPLDSPLSMYIEPTRTCNFKCFYCMHSTRGEKGGVLEQTGFRLAHMDMDLYEKLVRDIMDFPTPVKRVCFSGLGEPLMNPRLPEMIGKLRQAGFEGRVDVISNGALLTHALSDALIAAGLNRLQISIQGLNTQQYEENCGVAMDVDKLMAELDYFHRKAEGTNTTLFIKIIDIMLKSDTDREQFFQMFSSLCDTIFVEHLVIMEQQMGDHGGRADHTRNLNGELVEKRMVCGVMFYLKERYSGKKLNRGKKLVIILVCGDWLSKQPQWIMAENPPILDKSILFSRENASYVVFSLFLTQFAPQRI